MRVAVDVAVDEDHLAVQPADHSTDLKPIIIRKTVRAHETYVVLVQLIPLKVRQVVDLPAFAELHREH